MLRNESRAPGVEVVCLRSRAVLSMPRLCGRELPRLRRGRTPWVRLTAPGEAEPLSQPAAGAALNKLSLRVRGSTRGRLLQTPTRQRRQGIGMAEYARNRFTRPLRLSVG